MIRACRCRAYPTDGQKAMFAKTFGCCRKVWNLMLSDKQKHYAATGEALRTTPAMYKNDYPYLKEVDSLALANKQLDLEASYKAFWNKTADFPKFKAKGRCRDSYTTNNQNGSVRIENGRLRLPKVGYVKIKLHRTLPDGAKIKSATVSRDRDGSYYISILFEYERNIPCVPIPDDEDAVIGLDYKSDGLYADSKGRVCGSPKYYRLSQKRLSKMQRSLSRKQKGSQNYGKAKTKLAKAHKHVSNQRMDFLHKESTRLADAYDAVCVESLNMRSMSGKGFHNGKATMDSGYGMFVNMLDYKLADRGKYLAKIDKWYPSSQLCHKCGSRQRLPLSERVYHCPVCGCTADRDTNAAINIRNEGMRLLCARAAATA